MPEPADPGDQPNADTAKSQPNAGSSAGVPPIVPPGGGGGTGPGGLEHGPGAAEQSQFQGGGLEHGPGGAGQGLEHGPGGAEQGLEHGPTGAEQAQLHGAGLEHGPGAAEQAQLQDAGLGHGTSGTEQLQSGSAQVGAPSTTPAGTAAASGSPISAPVVGVIVGVVVLAGVGIGIGVATTSSSSPGHPPTSSASGGQPTTTGSNVASTTTTSSGGAAAAVSYTCTGAQIELFNNWNGLTVLNGAKPTTFSTGGTSYCLDSVATYHWNNGLGAPGGTITLSGPGIGSLSLHATATAGTAANVNWVANVSSGAAPVVLNGAYTVQDSSPSTWSQNQSSQGLGFVRVWVTDATKSSASGSSGSFGTTAYHSFVSTTCARYSPTGYPFSAPVKVTRSGSTLTVAFLGKTSIAVAALHGPITSRGSFTVSSTMAIFTYTYTGIVQPNGAISGTIVTHVLDTHGFFDKNCNIVTHVTIP